ncbi:uncharacterized protein LOC110050201 isoform X2 [Orbicella faveolata]|uniref:uncharacterized protein LOC110050201 isoform X2 n=1 Tax=Orbicella faveolata TaxID=48498 RepID=UPI0009E4A2F6|nr:uncharacterized protein LOC110050201 isoform X2 [Orbicella faveolata]
MTIAAMEPTQAVAGNEAPDYGQIYTLLSRIMRGQPPPNLTPLDARVILDLLTDLERRLAGHDVSSQVNFVTNKYKEVMENQGGTTSCTQTQLPARHGRAEAANNSSDPGSSSSKPRTPLFSLNPLNVPVQLLNLKKPTPVSSSQT